MTVTGIKQKPPHIPSREEAGQETATEGRAKNYGWLGVEWLRGLQDVPAWTVIFNP